MPTAPRPESSQVSSQATSRTVRGQRPLPVTTAADLVLQRRAVTVSVTGLVVQVAIAVTAYILSGYFARDYLSAASRFAALGIIPWAGVATAALFRRARTVETFELEAIARSGEGSSTIFDSEADARPAARRLDRIYRFGLPAATVLLGLLLLVAGLSYARLALVRQAVAPADPKVLSGLAAAIAFAGFVTGFYLMGMSRSLRWPTLRGGATYLLGTVLVMGLVAACVGAAQLGLPRAVAIVQYAVPAIMLLVGIEVLLNVVLDFYRPKPAAGENDSDLRPAFDSRLLQLFVSPGGVVRSLNEAVNYQFGFEITRSWFWRLLSRSFAWLIIFGVGVLMLMSSFIRVELNEQALVSTFGRLHPEPLQPGLHMKWPWPISSAAAFDVTRVREITVGTHTVASADHRHDAILWDTQDQGLDDRLLLVAPSKSVGEMAADRLDTADAVAGRAPAVALGAADLSVQYRIDPDGLIAYATSNTEPHTRLMQIAETFLAREMVKYDIDAAIGSERTTIVAAVERQLRAQVEEENLGLEVMWVGLAGVMPPLSVASEFNQTVASEQNRVRFIEQGRANAAATLAQTAGTADQARALAGSITEFEAAERAALRGQGDAEDLAAQATQLEQQLQRAGGEAAQALFDARGYRWSKENQARGQSDRVSSMRVAWDSAQTYFKRRELLRVLEEMMMDRPKDILLTDSPSHLSLDLQQAFGIGGGDTLVMPER